MYNIQIGSPPKNPSTSSTTYSTKTILKLTEFNCTRQQTKHSSSIRNPIFSQRSSIPPIHDNTSLLRPKTSPHKITNTQQTSLPFRIVCPTRAAEFIEPPTESEATEFPRFLGQNSSSHNSKLTPYLLMAAIITGHGEARGWAGAQREGGIYSRA